jgi:putative transposase
MPLPRYPSDLSDSEWAILENHCSRQPKSVVVHRSGRPGASPTPSSTCSGAAAPGGCCLKRVPTLAVTFYYHFWKWRRDVRLRQVHDRLREEVREAEGRERYPSGAVIDSQAVKGTGVGDPERGYDGAKRLSGRKRHLSSWTLLGVWCSVPASMRQVCTNARVRKMLLSDELKESLPRLELLWADGAYTGGFRRWAKEVPGWQVEASGTSSLSIEAPTLCAPAARERASSEIHPEPVLAVNSR